MQAQENSTGDFFNGQEMGRRPKGTNWRENDKVPWAWMAKAAKLLETQTKFARINLRTEAIKFENYWVAKTGKGAKKINWERTWINWALSAAERKGYRERDGAFSKDGAYQNDDDYGIGYRP